MDIMKIILDIENKAMDVLNSVDKTQEEQKTEQKMAEMERSFAQQTEKRISELKEKYAQSLASEVKALEKKEAMQEQKIIDIYEMKQKTWVEDITKRIIEG